MFAWLNNEGEIYKTHIPGEPNYYSGPRRGAQDDRQQSEKQAQRPFPANPHFVSQSVLSEDLRNEIWARVVQQKQSIRDVSVRLGVDMRRIGAVVRLVELERRMRSQVCSLPTLLCLRLHDVFVFD